MLPAMFPCFLERFPEKSTNSGIWSESNACILGVGNLALESEKIYEEIKNMMFISGM